MDLLSMYHTYSPRLDQCITHTMPQRTHLSPERVKERRLHALLLNVSHQLRSARHAMRGRGLVNFYHFTLSSTACFTTRPLDTIQYCHLTLALPLYTDQYCQHPTTVQYPVPSIPNHCTLSSTACVKPRSPYNITLACRQRILCRQPTGPNQLDHRDDSVDRPRAMGI